MAGQDPVAFFCEGGHEPAGPINGDVSCLAEQLSVSQEGEYSMKFATQ